MLIDAGWTLGKDWYNEYELEGMPNKSKVGFADYSTFYRAFKQEYGISPRQFSQL